jgi:hypothetical protein
MKLVVALVLFLMLSACAPTNPPPVSGGGNDFPNPQGLGKIIADNLSKGDHWGDSIALPAASTPAAIAQGVSVPIAPSSGLTKKANASLTIHFDLSDTSRGVVRVTVSLVSDSVMKNDTFLVLNDDAFRDSIKNNEHLYSLKGSSINRLTFVRSSYLFVDSDGDSIINNRDGKPNRLFASSSVTSPLSGIKNFEIEIDGGKDGNLDTKGDMRILQCRSLSLTQKGDTLSMVRYEKYRGDSVLFDAASRDSLLIRVRLIDTDALQRRTTAEAVFLIFPGDSAQNRPVYFRSAKTLSSGATVTSVVRGAGADSLFKASDTALAYVIIDNPDNDLGVDTLGLLIATGKNPVNAAGNALLGLYSHKIRDASDVRETIVAFAPFQPVEKGQAAESGSFTLQLIYADGRWVNLNGTVSPTLISAKYQDSKGNTGTLEWDRSGKPL